eukprot:Pgem_evm2s1914
MKMKCTTLASLLLFNGHIILPVSASCSGGMARTTQEPGLEIDKKNIDIKNHRSGTIQVVDIPTWHNNGLSWHKQLTFTPWKTTAFFFPSTGTPCKQSLIITYRARAGYNFSEEQCKGYRNYHYEKKFSECTYEVISQNDYNEESFSLFDWIILKIPPIEKQIHY